jgi:alkanesulfonate monooxygenase SsuD/methylene tetrahydromethanopterin reductase-like flavin-dependent oxidoreductase (luciferase family)
VQAAAKAAGRAPDAMVGGIYLTVAIDDDARRAEERLNAYMQQYYGQPAATMRARQVNYAGPASGLLEWLQGYVAAGASHLVLRFAGDHERHLRTVAAIRDRLG